MNKFIKTVTTITLVSTISIGFIGCEQQGNKVVDNKNNTNVNSEIENSALDESKLEDSAFGAGLKNGNETEDKNGNLSKDGLKVQSTEKLLDDSNEVEVTESGNTQEEDTESTGDTESLYSKSIKSILAEKVKHDDLYKFLKDNNLFIDYSKDRGYGEEITNDLEELRVKYVGKNIKDWKAKKENGKEIKFFETLDMNKNTIIINSRHDCPYCIKLATEILEKEVIPDLFNVIYLQDDSDVEAYNSMRKKNNLTFKLPTFFKPDKIEYDNENIGHYEGPVPIALLVTNNGYIYDVDLAGNLFYIYPFLDRTLNVID